MHTIKADYLIVGAGGAGIAFADTIIEETDATVAIVDRYHQPGGHWTMAYPFVRLHQPSAFYGVNSRKLGSDTIDRVGWNEGLYELATAGEICAYFDQVMQQQLLPTGRVSYYPMTEYLGAQQIRTLAGKEYCVEAGRIVDSTYLRTVVPSMRPAPYAVAAGIECISPNGLPYLRGPRERYVVIGAGKTGIDALLWLLRQGIAPERITWIMPRDSWLLDRAFVQPGPMFAEQTAAAVAAQLQSVDTATSVVDLFDRFENAGLVQRIDRSVQPTMFRCATVSQAELEQLRRVKDVVRMGRVTAIEPDTLVLTGGSLHSSNSTLYVDCTADGLDKRPPKPIFDGDHITLQTVRGCQQVFSAAFIAHVEAAYDDDESRNHLCVPVPNPSTPEDWLRMTITYNRNYLRWLEDDDLIKWLNGARLDQYGQMLAAMVPDDASRDDFQRQMKAALEANTEHLQRLLADIDRSPILSPQAEHASGTVG